MKDTDVPAGLRVGAAAGAILLLAKRGKQPSQGQTDGSRHETFIASRNCFGQLS
jgi:hypothetical protein